MGIGLLALELVNLVASLGILSGYRFPGTDFVVLIVVDAVPAAVFLLMFVLVVLRVRGGRNVAINRLAIVYLALATVQTIATVFYLVSSGRPYGTSLLWGVGVLGGAYLQVVAVFTGWYWLLDHSVPGGAFDFPEADVNPAFRPNLVDYVFISFNTNSTFGPTTELVKSRHVKLLMMLQTSLSLAILLVFVARLIGLEQ